MVDGAKSLHDPENGGHDAERRQGFRDGVEGIVRLHTITLESRDLLLHERFDLMGTSVADDDQAGIVADEECQVPVFQDAREGLEDIRFLGLIDVSLDLVARPVLQFPHQGIEEAEDREVMFPLGNGAGDCLTGGAPGVLHQWHGIGDDEGADRDAADDHIFPRLPDDGQMPAHGDIAADERADGNCQSDQDAQCPSPLSKFNLLTMS
ncbi:MAG: hypothetical protein K0Q60_4898 [Microvirga sp.]|nr:hypothetical protein [Microvirga sp.]